MIPSERAVVYCTDSAAICAALSTTVLFDQSVSDCQGTIGVQYLIRFDRKHCDFGGAIKIQYPFGAETFLINGTLQ